MVAELLKMTPEEGAAYLLSLKEKWDRYSLIETGLVEGRKIGRAEAKAQAFAQAKAECTKEIALNMKQNNVTVECISKYTDLTAEEIEQL